MTDRIHQAARDLAQKQSEHAARRTNQAGPDAGPIPQALLDRAAARSATATPHARGGARKNTDATGAKIVAAGVSLAAGIGLVGVMAAGAAGGEAAAEPVAQPAQRVIVIQQPAAAQPVAQLPAQGATPVTATLASAGATSAATAPTTTPTLPTVVVVERDPAPAAPSQESAPTAVTTSEGS